MARVVTAAINGPMTLSTYGKRLVSLSMFEKGKAFFGAALLLQKNTQVEHHEFVFLHLLCQSAELILKSTLLASDYDQYRPKLKFTLGHRLDVIGQECITQFGLKPMSAEFQGELDRLSDLYRNHLLRYGTAMDMFTPPGNIARNKVLRRLAAVIRLSQREFHRESKAI